MLESRWPIGEKQLSPKRKACCSCRLLQCVCTKAAQLKVRLASVRPYQKRQAEGTGVPRGGELSVSQPFLTFHPPPPLTLLRPPLFKFLQRICICFFNRRSTAFPRSPPLPGEKPLPPVTVEARFFSFRRDDTRLLAGWDPIHAPTFCTLPLRCYHKKKESEDMFTSRRERRF